MPGVGCNGEGEALGKNQDAECGRRRTMRRCLDQEGAKVSSCPSGGQPLIRVYHKQTGVPIRSFTQGLSAPGFRKDDTPLIRTPGGLMERFNASLQRGRQG